MKINKTQLQEALEKVRPGLSSKEMIEQTTSFTFMKGRVVTYNDEISISHPVEGLDITGAVKAQALYKFLDKVKKDEIDITWEEKQIIIKAGRSKAGLIFEQEVKLPIEAEIGRIEKWKKLPKNFVEALKFCYPCCSRDMSRPVLTCVSIGKESIQASDSYQIVLHTLDKTMPIKVCLIPANAAKELVKYHVTSVAIGESWLHFKTEDETIFSSRILNNEFPDTSKHLEFDGVKFEFPKNIDQILERANVFSKKVTSPGAIPTVTIEIGDGQVKVAAENEYGWFKEETRTKYDGKPVKFVIGIEFVLGIFGKLRKCTIGESKIGFSGENWKHMVAVMTPEEEK